MKEQFDKPTNQWIEEDVNVEVTTPKFDEKTKTVSMEKEIKTFKQKTYYAESIPTKIVCNEHVYKCLDKGKYLFKCTKCDWNRVVYPVSFKFDEATGILTRRDSGERV